MFRGIYRGELGGSAAGRNPSGRVATFEIGTKRGSGKRDAPFGRIVGIPDKGPGTVLRVALRRFRPQGKTRIVSIAHAPNTHVTVDGLGERPKAV